ncbi:MAG: DMT family transporter [Chloroflexi bacterium]|nr:DMT family transporter [Chloroflexota bacterium]
MNSETRFHPKELLPILATPIFLGMAPVFGKLAYGAGADAFGVAALRTLVAVVLMWLFYIIFFRQYIYIYPAGLLGCMVIGVINGIGSLFYYGGLSYLDASLVQLLNGMYLPIAVLLSHLGGQRIDRRTALRVLLAWCALLVITGFGGKQINWFGVGLMLGSALMFAGTFIFSQYVLYEMPAPTGALYILTTMGVVVTVVWLAVGAQMTLNTLENAVLPIIALGITTALSRLAMFAGVKLRGSVETAVTAIAEIGVALLLAGLILGEQLSPVQWGGVGLLFITLLLIRRKDLLPHGYNPNALLVSNMASVQFQRIAFHRAFGTQEQDNEQGVMATLTADELMAIQRMMGAKTGPVDPFPISPKAGYSIDLKSFLPRVVKPADKLKTREIPRPSALETAKQDKSEPKKPLKNPDDKWTSKAG